jgi:dTDP-4-amino-4,6-dideoxygalactose transaminase
MIHKNIPLFDPKKQYLTIKKEIDSAITNVLESGVYTLGKETKVFENNFADYIDRKFAVSTNSGTDSLLLSLKVLDIKPGDEVITAPNTFFATAEAISRSGAIPIFADIDTHTLNIDPKKIRDKISDKTKAIIPVHLFGNPCNIKGILEIAKEFNLKIIEDCCQAAGAEYNNKKIGSFGDFACFSFYPTKNLNCYGDAGIIVLNNEQHAEKINIFKNHGRKNTNEHSVIGYNSRMDELQATILHIKLRYLDSWNEKNAKTAERYKNEINNSKISFPLPTKNSKRVFYTFPIICEDRERLISHLEKKNICTGIYYPIPIHLQEAYLYLKNKKGDFPIAEKISEKILSLPLFPELADDEISFIIKTINNFN